MIDAEDYVKDELECLADGRCSACREIVDGKQVGRCVYCEKCGHRMYQGRITKKRPQDAASGETA